ncbi:hypothetical protein HRR83_008197 [Exophiala dermatitidis]|uniref:BZIP domain-containing protein n=2 Tax=Exophiala dermatitidis TaxID=5970 RepID=H6BSS4_EXODN|nr:uncharacterized protein HMPREF1120_02400 [Exophiala dermatitidis NIH/UT8656]KAJ4505824.1 hypothetical protein HRR75_007205 [Exophiala dermatitidis]EHY54228.1 hypothetical protein HMPREF1120_02400 [Exophiala dermatitidis NIH/UT8656]KAJ4507963.1 hypothetical protein HRR74_007848 [Exophiala dermatitidis]KAJ4513626.1 hypothetical protein HRR73_005784 [Exophiala dermatitidis]KAJ4535528.1 hypothetical protein HRR77_007847 [Exophiala dermatitidis]
MASIMPSVWSPCKPPVAAGPILAASSPALAEDIGSETPVSNPTVQQLLVNGRTRSYGKQTPKEVTNYGSGIHFVDMADKKGAQRIRNTINSRKHRQNKLNKIRELEKKLATCEADMKKWQGRANQMGWKEESHHGV